MAKSAHDQAEGLRRMFAGDVRRMVGVLVERDSACGHLLAANLAITLGASGCKVLLLDEGETAGKTHPVFSVKVERDLSQVLRGKTDMASAVMSAAPGVDLLAGGWPHIVRRPPVESQIAFVNTFYRLAGAYDVVLIAAIEEGMSSYPSFTWAAQDIIVLCGNRSDSVTTAYSRIKALQQGEERRFHILFEQMPPARAQTMFRNLATVSHRHLGATPDDLGVLPQESASGVFVALAKSIQGWPLPAQKDGHFRAFMQRLLHGTPKRISHLAVRSG